MAAVQHIGGLRATQHLDEVIDAEALLQTIDAGEHLLCILNAVISLRRVQTDITVTTGLFGTLVEIVQQHLTTTGLRLGKSGHGIELMQLDLLLGTRLRLLYQMAYPADIGGVEQHQGLRI